MALTTRSLPRWLTAAAFLLLAGCATPPPADDPEALADYQQINDPWEPTNRVIFDLNTWLDDNMLLPVARAYRAVTPRFLRDRLNDFIANLKSPVVLANDVLEGNVRRTGDTIGRFLLNSSFGVGGLMDVATPLGLPGHAASVADTLAVWGIGEGPYLVLPLFGPSNPRDAAGLGIESFMDPLSYYLANHHMRWVSTTRFLVTGVAARESYIDVLEEIKRSSLDYYSAMRSLYRQRREQQIRDALVDTRHP